MRPLGVVEPEIAGNPVAGIPWRAIVGQVDLLIFQVRQRRSVKMLSNARPLPSILIGTPAASSG